MKEFKTLKYWKIAFYILGSIPLIFIISLLTFYIYYGIILGFWGISGINPYKFPASKIYQHIIIYSWVITFFCIPIFVITTIFYFIKNKNEKLKKIIIASAIIFMIAILLIFSKILLFALD